MPSNVSIQLFAACETLLSCGTATVEDKVLYHNRHNDCSSVAISSKLKLVEQNFLRSTAGNKVLPRGREDNYYFAALPCFRHNDYCRFSCLGEVNSYQNARCEH